MFCVRLLHMRLIAPHCQCCAIYDMYDMARYWHYWDIVVPACGVMYPAVVWIITPNLGWQEHSQHLLVYPVMFTPLLCVNMHVC